ncbi:MAG: hypothetical protein AB1632_13190 [Nitrospirota bacterium]
MLGNKYFAFAVGILLVLVIAYNVNYFTSKRGVAGIPAVKKAAPAGQPLSTAGKMPDRILEKEDNNPWRRDPFGLHGRTGKSGYEGGIHLVGIIKREGRSRALINGNVLSVNDRVGDAVIREIRRHSVVLFSGGKTQEVFIDDYTVLKENAK